MSFMFCFWHILFFDVAVNVNFCLNFFGFIFGWFSIIFCWLWRDFFGDLMNVFRWEINGSRKNKNKRSIVVKIWNCCLKKVKFQMLFTVIETYLNLKWNLIDVNKFYTKNNLLKVARWCNDGSFYSKSSPNLLKFFFLFFENIY